MKQTGKEKRAVPERRSKRERRTDAERRSDLARREGHDNRSVAERRVASEAHEGSERRTEADRRGPEDRRSLAERRKTGGRRAPAVRRGEADRREAKAKQVAGSGSSKRSSEGHTRLRSASAEEHREAAEELGALECAIVVVSDTRTESTDRSGAVAQELIAHFGHNVVQRDLIKNDAEAIRRRFHELVTGAAQLVVFCGGTGLGKRDITVETVTPLLDKVLEGFGEAFRRFSWDEIGNAAILSRAVGGAANGTVVICTPGSSAAVRLALERIVLPELRHLVREANR